MSEQYIKLKDAAEMLGISPRTLRYQISLGKIQAEKKGHSWLISKYSLELYCHPKKESLSPPTDLAKEPTKAHEPYSSKMASFRCLELLKEVRRQTLDLKELIEDYYYRRFDHLLAKSAEDLGRGYVSPTQLKIQYYTQARAEMGAALALVYSLGLEKVDEHLGLRLLKDQLIPATTATIKKKFREQPKPLKKTHH